MFQNKIGSSDSSVEKLGGDLFDISQYVNGLITAWVSKPGLITVWVSKPGLITAWVSKPGLITHPGTMNQNLIES